MSQNEKKETRRKVYSSKKVVRRSPSCRTGDDGLAVVSHWQNPTPGPFVSIRWEQLGVISPPSPPINWEIIQMRTQLSNNIVSSHDHENSREVLVCQWSNVRHSKKYISGLILVKLHIKHHQVWKGKGCMWFLG